VGEGDELVKTWEVSPMSSPLTISDSSFDQVVLESQVPVLVDFWAPWCGPCRVIAPIVEELAEEYGNRVAVGKFNVDGNAQTPTKYGIQSIPTLLLFKNGKPVQQLVGLKSKKELKQILDTALA